MSPVELPITEIVDPTRSLWGLPLQPAGCPVCGQAHLVEQGWLGRRCPNCGKGALELQPARLRPESPERLLPFRLQPGDLGPIFQAYVKPVWLRPGSLNPSALLERLAAVYLPMWLVDADLAGDWQAEAGFDYQVQSSQEAYTSSGWKTRQVVETRTRWEPRLGQIERHYENVAAPALSDHAAWMESLGDFKLGQAVPFEPGQVQARGPVAIRVPDQPPEAAWPLVKDALERAASADCRRAAGAQHMRRFSLHVEYANLHWTQLLLPVYTTFYIDDAGNPRRIILNGQTGAIAGKRLASQRKGWRMAGISALVAIAIFLFSLALFALAAIAPPLSVLGALGMIVAFGVGIFAIVPAIWPWGWNQRQ